tara:strand:+ start:165 stop:572 length:408 start_codon:yes stop_codon:yes gene_type:complete
MSKEQLETNIAALELLVNETFDKSTDYKAQLEQARQDLKDINKPVLTPSQLDNIYEAIEAGVGEFDFSDTDNYDKDFELDYDGRVQLSNFDLSNSQDLVEMIVEKVHKLFVEAEELDTTEDDNHITHGTHIEKII